MNEQNVSFLKDSVKYLGFGESLHPEIENQIAAGTISFALPFQQAYPTGTVEAQLHFRRSEQSGLYFLNKWEGTLLTETGKRNQTFYLTKGKGVTLKEGFNLLEGRAVHKELQDKQGRSYHAWIQLDQKDTTLHGNHKVQQYHERYGYNLAEVISYFPIKELMEPQQKEQLIRALERGNLQPVSFEKNGLIEKLFIEANPHFKSLNVYTAAGEKLPVQSLEKKFDFTVPAQSEKQSERKSQGKEKERETRNKQGQVSEGSTALLPKQRQSKKGLRP